MDRLARTRSQHFVHSPRRMASPLKGRNATANGNGNGHATSTRHPTKRRRLGSAAHTLPPRTNLFNPNSNSDTDTSPEGSGHTRRVGQPLDANVGQQAINRHASAHARLGGNGAAEKKDIKGKGKAVTLVPEVIIYSSEDGSSPRKRKRHHSGSGASQASISSSWVEMDEDEAEPEFIAESDQHLIDEAPAYALHRLRKAELIRLWKVAGMWEGDEDADGAVNVEEEDNGMSKRELVEGIVAARKPTSGLGASASQSSPRRKVDFDTALAPERSTSAASATPSKASSDDANSPEVTPRALPRTRSNARVRVEGSATKPVKRRAIKGVRERLLKARSKSMGGPGDREKDERKARFGDDVKSPAHGLLTRRVRRASTMSSSTYTTTDTSPPATPVNSRQASKRIRKSGNGSVRRLGKSSSTPGRRLVSVDQEDDAVAESDSDSDADPTPLIQRLRPRTKSTASEHVSEADMDGEDELTEDEGDAEAGSSGPSSRLRSKDQLDLAGQSRERNAKLKAKQALKGGEETETDGEMDIDEDGDDDGVMTEEPGPISKIKTKSKSRTDQETTTTSHKRHTRRNSRLIAMDGDLPVSEASSALTPPPQSNGGMDIVGEETETETETEATRTTRSGRAFGVWQSRRKRLRQEALDDPDMEVDEEDEEVAESDDDEDDSFEADTDLADATIASLTRLLRDELVGLCEARGIEVGGTKPQLAKALIAWRDEQLEETASTSTLSQATARPSSSSSGGTGRAGQKTKKPGKVIHAIGSNKHVSGKTTPVLLRDHIHAHDPDTPPLSDPPSEQSKRTNGEAELNFDLQELGLEDTVIRPDLLQKLEKIGSGGFKDVYVGKYRGRKVAISEFREHLSEMDIRELKLLSEFSHPNIVKFRGICIPEDNSQVQCMLVSELCENGDLFDYIRNVDCPSLKRVLGLMLDIAKGLEYLHNHKPPIIHRDCKSSNILINRAGHAKVGDFGLARVKNSTRSMIRSLVGTVNWQAPELWSPHPRYDYKVDVFSAGLVFWEMMAGWTGDKKYPWEGHNEHYIYDAVGAKHRRPSTAGLRKHWGTEPVNLMERMWHQDPGERPTMTDVVTDLEILYGAA